MKDRFIDSDGREIEMFEETFIKYCEVMEELHKLQDALPKLYH